MKKLIMITVIALGVMGCEPNKPSEHWLQKAVPPIICICTGTFMTDCIITVVDGNGNIYKKLDNALCSVQRGDTLIK